MRAAAAASAEAPAKDEKGAPKEKPKDKADAGPALKVKVSISENEDFTRISLSPSVPTTYEFVETPDQKGVLIVNFGRYGLVDLSDLREKTPRYVYDIQISSALRDTLQLKIAFPESSRQRAFLIASRGIIDVFAPTKAEELSKETRKARREALRSELSEQQQEKISIAASQETKDGAAAEAAKAVPQKQVDLRPAKEDATRAAEAKQQQQRIQNAPVNANIRENTITFSSTESFNMAAFERLGYLWAVIDRADMAIPPVVEGPQKDMFENPERIALDGGLAYRFKLPDGVYVQPQGGGFIWKLVVSGRPQALTSAPIRKNFVRDGDSTVSLGIKNARNLLKVSDPTVGDDFAVVTVPKAETRIFQNASFVDIDVIPAFIGAVLVPKSDGIRIEADDDKVTIRRIGGLNVGPAVAVFKAQPTTRGVQAETKVEQGPQSMFNFAKWGDEKGGTFDARKKDLEIQISESGGQRRRTLLLNKAELLVSHDMAHEALGYLELAEVADTQITTLPEYKAVKGVAQVASWRYGEALKNFSNPVLQSMGEVKFWQALAHGGLGAYDKAYADLPGDLNFLKAYPPELRNTSLLQLAEIALQNKDSDLLKSITEQLAVDMAVLSGAQKAGLSYYKGRLAMMSGLPGDVKVHLAAAVANGDLYYATRAELALVNEQLRNKEITPEQSLPRLERIRFAWRGDDLELDINKRLGEMYIANGEEQKGMNILRGAAEMAQTRTARNEIINTMSEAFKSLFLKDEGEPLKPLEALGVYEEFKELLPAGDDGDAIIGTIADKLVSVDLLSRAVSLLEERMGPNLAADKRPRWALKAAAISLLNRKPADAIRLLDKVPASQYEAAGLGKRAGLIRARALADLKRTREAMAILDELDGNDPEIIGLKADTGWRGQQWGYAATAFNQLLAQDDIQDGKALTTDQARMILNTAIALNLSGDTAGLETLRTRYDAVMRSSPLYKSFQIVTRPIRAAVISDRDTLMSHVFEVDMFGKSLGDISTIKAGE